MMLLRKANENGSLSKSPNAPPKLLYQGLAHYQSAKQQWVPFAIIGLLVVNLLALWSTKSDIQTVQRQEKYAFLQKTDGSTERIEQVNSLERSPEILKKFAYDWTKTCFTWTGVFDGKPDKGIGLFGRMFPTRFANCSIAIDPTFRRSYMTGLYNLYQTHPIFSDQLALSSFIGSNTNEKREVQIYVQALEPVKVGKGYWDVPVVATREFRKAGEPFAVEKFNQTLRLKAIPPYLPPWSSAQKDQSVFGKLLDEWQLQGVQILKITKMGEQP